MLKRIFLIFWSLLQSKPKWTMQPNWFVGFPVSGDWYLEFCNQLPKELRLFHKDDLHITLAFLGHIDNVTVEKTIKKLEAISEEKISISLGPLILLPRQKNFTAISFSIIEGKTELIRMMQKYQSVFLEKIEDLKNSKRPLPHITIARPTRKSTNPQKQIINNELKTLQVPNITFILKEIALYTWSEQRPKRQFKKYYKKSLS